LGRRGDRTHTFGVRRAGVDQRSLIILSHGKPIPTNGNGEEEA
jgi:hypothetical protein